MTEIFISYSKSDRCAAQELAQCLSDEGIDVWWDALLDEGSSFRSEIGSRLTEASLVIVLWTPNSIKSGWVVSEALQARDAGSLLSLCWNAIPPLGFRQHQYFELSFPLSAKSIEVERLRLICRNALASSTLSLMDRRGFVAIDFARRYRLTRFAAIWKGALLYTTLLVPFTALNGWSAWRGVAPLQPVGMSVLGYVGLVAGRLILPDSEGIFRNRPERFLEPNAVWTILACYLATYCCFLPNVLASQSSPLNSTIGLRIALMTLAWTPPYFVGGLFLLPTLALRLLDGVGLFGRGSKETLKTVKQHDV